MKIGNFGKVLCATALSATMANAQDINAYKALNFSKEDPTLGSARYAGMGGAMGAIGGSTSALKDNAANIAAGTKSDIGMTFDLYSNNDSRCSFAVSDVSLLFNIDHHNRSGYMSSAFAIAYNRNRTFDSDLYKETKFVGENGQFINYSKVTDHEEGGADVINFAYAGNINNQVYFGIALGITDLRFEKRNIYEDTELAQDFACESRGSGVNFNVGLLYQPTDAVRFGVGFQTPTRYDIDEHWDMWENGDILTDPEFEYAYKIHTPMKFSAQLGFMIGDKANIGIDYSMRNYSNTWAEFQKLKLRYLEEDFKTICKTQHTVKVGGEVNLTDGFDIRAGYAMTTEPVIPVKEACSKLAAKDRDGCYAGDYWLKDENGEEYYDGPMYTLLSPKMNHYISAGFGYSGRFAYVDFAYIRKIANVEYVLNSPFNKNQCDLVSENTEEYKHGSNHFMLSFGFHF